jgi:hypothetical protein
MCSTGTACAAHALEPSLLLALHSLRCCLEDALHWPTLLAATQRGIYWKVKLHALLFFLTSQCMSYNKASLSVLALLAVLLNVPCSCAAIPTLQLALLMHALYTTQLFGIILLIAMICCQRRWRLLHEQLSWCVLAMQDTTVDETIVRGQVRATDL